MNAMYSGDPRSPYDDMKGRDILLCPYCDDEMHKGVIHGERYATKWVPEENDRGSIFQWFSKGVILEDL